MIGGGDNYLENARLSEPPEQPQLQMEAVLGPRK
jgi:hypothetical protein